MYTLAVKFGLVNTNLAPAYCIEVGWQGRELGWEGEGNQERTYFIVEGLWRQTDLHVNFGPASFFLSIVTCRSYLTSFSLSFLIWKRLISVFSGFLSRFELVLVKHLSQCLAHIGMEQMGTAVGVL